MRYMITVPANGNEPVELVKPENSSVMEDLLALGFFAKCMYESIEDEQDRKQYIKGVQALSDPILFTKVHTKKS